MVERQNDKNQRTGSPGTDPRKPVGEEAFAGTPASTGSTPNQGQEHASDSGDASSKAQRKAGEAVDTARDKVGDVAGQARQKVDEASTKLQEKTDQGVSSAASGLGKAAETLRSQGEQRGGTVGSAASTAATQLEQTSSYLENKDTDQLMSDLESLVRRKPVESMLVAAGAGFILSRIFS